VTVSDFLVQSATACDACDNDDVGYAFGVSKAFTKESDVGRDEPMRRRGVPVPEGVPNYVTPAGARALRAEVDELGRGERAPELEARLRELGDHLATAEVVEAPADQERVAFGATVTLEDENGDRTRYRIVGAIEASPREGAIGWQSPLARTMMGARVGDTIKLPRGGEAEIISIEYE
jgi:transcription elongation factor GreB